MGTGHGVAGCLLVFRISFQIVPMFRCAGMGHQVVLMCREVGERNDGRAAEQALVLGRGHPPVQGELNMARFKARWKRLIPGGWMIAAVAMALIQPRAATAAEEEPKQWEALFFPFPIVGAPPQLEQQVQLFDSYFHGSKGSAHVASAELAYIATPHLGFVLTVPYQFGVSGQPNGFGDASLLAQWLAAGSLRLDNMISIGVQATFPTAQNGIGSGDYFVGPFVFAAQRFWRRLILEANLTTLLPVVHGDSARQIAAAGLLSVLVTPLRFDYPVYIQAEVDSTTYLGGTAALPPLTASSPAQTVFLAPEVFLGPFASPVSDGTRVALGYFFNLTGDPIHSRTFAVTVAFDIPNRFGY